MHEPDVNFFSVHEGPLSILRQTNL